MFYRTLRSFLNMSIDGWSNVHNEPIICAFDTIDTSGHPHTANYLCTISCNFIERCKSEYNCAVSSFVTDNAANMAKMRENIREFFKSADLNLILITYGCSAHILNLLLKYLEIHHIKEEVVTVW